MCCQVLFLKIMKKNGITERRPRKKGGAEMLSKKFAKVIEL